MSQSDNGMGTGAKVVLALLGVGCVLVLLCCGGAYWWGKRAMEDFRRGIEEGMAGLDEMYFDEPAEIAALTASIVEIRIPPRYEPSLGEDLTTIDVQRKQVQYVSADGSGRLIIREMGGDDITTRDDSAQVLADEVSAEGWDYSLQSPTSSRRTFVIAGEECQFEFQSGKDTGPGSDMWQVTGSFPSESGLAYLLINDRAEHWDEAAIVAMIESIRIGSAGPTDDSATTGSSPADSPGDAATGTSPGEPAQTPEAPAAESTPTESSTPGAARASPPNVLYIISDDQAWTDYGFMGHDTIKTPHLDRLASQSAVFTRGYVPDSLCRPSLATLITGLYPHQHKISGNDPRHGGQTGSPRRAPEYLQLNAEYIRHIEAVPTLPRLLAERGCLSLQTGKWWEGDYGRGGFTHGMTHGDPARGGRHGDEGLTIGREGLQPIYDFIREAGDRPWLVWYAPFLPHSPHNPPERLLQKYAAPDKSLHVARYQAMCEWFDETCGELLAHLDDKGLAENTLVVYVTDNGWIQDPDSPRYAPRSKRSPYDGGVRTPILLRWPGRIAPARYEETLVSSVDLVPTILSAAGVAPPESLPGLNLLDVCTNGGKSDRGAVSGAIFEHDVPDIHNPAAGLMYRWCIGGWWKLIVPADAAQEIELYDLQTDPHELTNVSKVKGNLETVTALRQTLDAWWTPESP